MSTRYDHPDLRAVQRAQADMLAVLDRVCAAHAIPYFAAYGTALGAVRGGGPIPWDWDADVLVPIEQYPILLRALRAELPGHLALAVPGDPGYEPLFARIWTRGTPHAFLHVDLFVLAGAPRSSPGRKVRQVANRALCRACSMKVVSLAQRPHFGRGRRIMVRMAKTLLFPVPLRVLRRAHAALNSSSAVGAAWVTNPAGTYGRREFFPGRWFERSGRAPFSDGQVAVPGDHEAFLTSLYGPDFAVPIPPQEQQRQYDFFVEHVAPHLGPLR